MTDLPQEENPPRHEIYVPGYAKAKVLFIVLGLVLLASSFDKFWPALQLGFTGGRARGEAVRIVRVEAGGREFIYTTEAETLASVKTLADTRDRASVFWVEYAFLTNDGRRIETRSPIGQHVTPLQQLRDLDGLPTTIAIWYDPNNPTRILLPLQFGTWYLPGMLAMFGGLAIFMGTLLLRHAKRPIEMPDLSHSHAEISVPSK